MMTNVRDSDYSTDPILVALHDSMESAIPEFMRAPRETQQDYWSGFEDRSLKANRVEGFLYEYYLGYIPKKDDWDMLDAKKGMYLDRP